MTITVLIPVLDRPHRVEPLLQSLSASQRDAPLEPLFIVSSNDRAQLEAIWATGAPFLIADWEPGSADFARKTNLACARAETDWLLAGADDLEFHYGWADEAIFAGEHAGKRFVATNDKGNGLVMKGRHATHPLVHRSYLPLAVVDAPGLLYSEAYDHNCVDVEATETAMLRGEFVFAPHAIVEHKHPIWHKGEMDETYEKGMKHGRTDRALLNERRHLWGGAPDPVGRRRVPAQGRGR